MNPVKDPPISTSLLSGWWARAITCSIVSNYVILQLIWIGSPKWRYEADDLLSIQEGEHTLDPGSLEPPRQPSAVAIHGYILPTLMIWLALNELFVLKLKGKKEQCNPFSVSVYLVQSYHQNIRFFLAF